MTTSAGMKRLLNMDGPLYLKKRKKIYIPNQPNDRCKLVEVEIHQETTSPAHVHDI